MNQHDTAWPRKVIFLSMAILAVLPSVARVKPAYTQVTPANFDKIDAHIADVGWVAAINGISG